MKIKLLTTIVACTVCLSLFGCSQKAPVETAGQVSPEPVSTEPVTLKVGMQDIILNEAQFNKYVVEPVKKKHPNITLELINTSVKGSNLPELVASGNIPDIIGMWLPEIERFKKLGLLQNIEPLMKKYNVGQDQFAPEMWNTLKLYSSENYAVGIPIYYNTIALLYNKDIFDKFGVSYPTDGMTWEEVTALGKKVGRGSGEDLYTGFFPDGLNRLQMQLNLPLTDPSGKKAALNTNDWKDAFDLWKSILDVQNTPPKGFPFEKGRVAMIGAHINIVRAAMTNKELSWDVVTYPQSKKLPGVGQRPDGPSLAVTSTSKYKDAAFQVIQTVISPEVQLEMTKDGNLSTLIDPKIREQFGKNIEEFKGKNIQAFLKPKFANGVADPPLTDSLSASKFVMNEFNAAMDKKQDTNTALREINEKLDKMLSEAGAGSK